MKKVLVIHPFQQHSFQTAIAVDKAGFLYKYVTMVYNKKGSITNFVTRFLKGDNKKRAENRKNFNLDDNKIKQFNELGALFLLLLQRIDKSHKLYNLWYLHLLKSFNKHVFNYIKKNNIDCIIVYDILSYYLIEKIKKNKMNIKIILDMSAPYYPYMQKMYLDDCEVHKENSVEFKKTLSEKFLNYRNEAAKIEVANSDYFLSASSFTDSSLLYAGVKKEKIFRCIYGIDNIKENLNNLDERKKEDTLKIMYVGSINRQKGAYQLIRVANRLMNKNILFDFYGSYDSSDPIYINNKNKYNFLGHIPKDDMIKAYSKYDLLVFPSLADGFGFTVIEALSQGVPAIVSCNAGSKDVINDGVDGIIYDVTSDENLLNVINELYNNRKKLYDLRNNISNNNSLTWDNYYNAIKKVLKQVL